MNWLTARLIPSNVQNKEQAGGFSVITNPGTFISKSQETRMLEERLNRAASDFYLTVTSADETVRSEAYSDLSTQDPEVVAKAFIEVLRRTDGFDRKEWGREFIHTMHNAYLTAQKWQEAEAFCNSLTRGLLDVTLGIPQDISAGLMAAALSHVQINFSDIPNGASYDLGLQPSASGNNETP